MNYRMSFPEDYDSLHEFVRGLRDGEDLAWDHVRKQWAKNVRRVLLRNGLNYTDAEEALSEAFKTLFEQREAIDPTNNPYGYFRQIAIRASTSFPDYPHISLLSDPEESGEKEVGKDTEVQREVRNAIRLLTDNERLILNARFYESNETVPHKVIAGELEKTDGAFRVALMRVLRKLQAILEARGIRLRLTGGEE